MHGRLKTISSEEQKIKQEKARQEKMQLYRFTMDRIIDKRMQKDTDDEALTITKNILFANPDIISLWNYRRQIFESRMIEIDSFPEEILQADLSLVEQCLRVNPKSYGAWYHRIWILDHMPKSYWEKEILLCNKYLTLDERNFHCWDYRRTVAQRANIPDIDEYNFTTKMIESNFSNYSAWHLRSKLIPKLFNDPSKKFPVIEEKLREELELVQNAAFTDPDDQSAWFYMRWLLNIRSPGIKIISIYADLKTGVVGFSKEIRLGNVYNMTVKVNNKEIPVEFSAPCQRKVSSMWNVHIALDVVSICFVEKCQFLEL